MRRCDAYLAGLLLFLPLAMAPTAAAASEGAANAAEGRKPPNFVLVRRGPVVLVATPGCRAGARLQQLQPLTSATRTRKRCTAHDAPLRQCVQKMAMNGWGAGLTSCQHEKPALAMANGGA